MYRFLLTRRWLLASVVVLTAVVVMVLLGMWQLRRADEVRSDNDRVRAQLALPPAPIEQLLPAGADPSAATYRRVEVSGRYEQDEEIALDNRSNHGRAGKHLLTPLVASAGRALIVDRGWIPLDGSPQPAEPPSTEVRVVGVLFPSERKGSFGASIPPEGDVKAVPRVDVARIAEQLPYPTYPLYLRLQSQIPAQTGGLPIAPGLPEIDDGPHVSYAVQWFLFAAVALAVFGALARREALRPARRVPVA
jgi:surfeit locus 1 family protein